ncbi:hypothetical protein EKL94_05080 [Stenotrophomonas maltophilia]|uniref:Uncharacterized protein n=1 Tax=Stenotrophomonas maltophilia TaxID=40324 RepID=A0A3S0JP63_STEMA|nr:hypothetical protein EKL94_05080 [Stenotrophomonas maltophilia]
MPAAGRHPGNATGDHEVAGQRPALPQHSALPADGNARLTAPAAGALRNGRRPVPRSGPQPVHRGNP